MKCLRIILCSLSVLALAFWVLSTGCSFPANPDTTPPQISILHPADGEVVTGVVPIVVAATDNDEVKLIRVFVDGVEVFSGPFSSTTFNWDTGPLADNRDHFIAATAEDPEGNIGTTPIIAVRVVGSALPDTLAPVIRILNPLNGQIVSNPVRIVTQVTDDSPIQKVEFYIDGALVNTDVEFPYEYIWDVSGLINGSRHSIFAWAYDASGFSSASNVVSVTVATNVQGDIKAPKVTILFPAANSIFSASTQGTINVAADASDESGIDRVEFFIDGVFKSADSTAPYEYLWDLAPFADGQTHTVYVKAFDKAGNDNAALVAVKINP
ncbi:MAG: hypothetical protein D6715_06455 [Calditrichaeota bacterium]|nr:MAG: hypothetical protein D6715_06455 [Calditrichota bacterium]